MDCYILIHDLELDWVPASNQHPSLEAFLPVSKIDFCLSECGIAFASALFMFHCETFYTPSSAFLLTQQPVLSLLFYESLFQAFL